jgi:hypothetical protein
MNLRSTVFLNLFSSIVGAFWRLPCYSRLGVSRIDTIVSEGFPSQHAHTLHEALEVATNSIYYDVINVHPCGPPLVQAREKAWRYAGTRLAKRAVD